ncbi:MAG TPA: DUF3299 domain-containing protein [Planctomycetota bacterium]|jgi:hypothetical protein
MNHEPQTTRTSNVLTAVAVAACLLLGVWMTVWLNAPPERSHSRKPLSEIRGDPIKGSRGGAQIFAPQTNNSVMATSVDQDYTAISFEELSGFYYELPPPPDPLKLRNSPQLAPAIKKDQIPKGIKSFDGQKVAVQGFMWPLENEKGAVKTFMLLKDQQLCCFGRFPRINEWVRVKMAGNRATRYIPDQPVTVFGLISVGEEIQNGEVTSLYRLVAEDVAGPMDL